jgi:hypothetical protein
MRLKRRGEDNIKMDHQEIGWESVVWIDLARHRDLWQALVDTVMNVRVQ